MNVLSVELQKGEPFGHEGHETNVLARIVHLGRVDPDEPDLPLVPFREPDLHRVAVINDDHPAGVREAFDSSGTSPGWAKELAPGYET